MATYNKTTKDFFEIVYTIVRMIPKGRVTSYGAIAKCIGTKGTSRMVGWAMNACHTARPKVPAHRVVNRSGVLTGKHHFGNNNEMQQRLEAEGIEVKNDKIVNFKNLFWDPMHEIKL